MRKYSNQPWLKANNWLTNLTGATEIKSMDAALLVLDRVQHIAPKPTGVAMSPAKLRWSQITPQLIRVITHDFGLTILKWRLAREICSWRRQGVVRGYWKRDVPGNCTIDTYALELLTGPDLGWTYKYSMDGMLDRNQGVAKAFLSKAPVAINKIDQAIQKLWKKRKYERTKKRLQIKLLTPPFSGRQTLGDGPDHPLNIRAYDSAIPRIIPFDMVLIHYNVIEYLVQHEAAKVTMNNRKKVEKTIIESVMAMANMRAVEGQLGYSWVIQRILLKELEKSQLLTHLLGNGPDRHLHLRPANGVRSTPPKDYINYDLVVLNFLPGVDAQFLAKFKALVASSLGLDTALLLDPVYQHGLTLLKFDEPHSANGASPKYTQCHGFGNQDNQVIFIMGSMVDRVLAQWISVAPRDVEKWLVGVFVALEHRPELFADMAVRDAISRFRENVLAPPLKETYFNANDQWSQAGDTLTDKMLTLLD